METEEPVWTQDDLKLLLKNIKKNIPFSEKSHIHTQKMIDWKNIAFSKYSAEECQAKWKQMCDKMRKIRTMTELVEEAECAIDDPFKSHRDKIHPELPKRPANPLSMYMKKTYKAFKEQHPHLSQRTLMPLICASYKELPAHEKAEYVENFKRARKQYNQDQIHLRKQYGKPFQERRLEEHEDPDAENSIQSAASSSRPGKEKSAVELPGLPPLSGIAVFMEEQRASFEPGAPVDYVKKIRRRWTKMGQLRKNGYNERSMELRRQYGLKLNAFLSNLTKEKKEVLRQDLGMLLQNATKRNPQPLMFPGEPEKPSSTGTLLYYSEKMLHRVCNYHNPRETSAVMFSLWSTLSTEERASYNKKAKIKFKSYTLELQEWFRTLSSEDQEDYVKTKPEQAPYVTRGEDRPAAQRRLASDSEDEDYQKDYTDIHAEDDGNDDDDDDSGGGGGDDEGQDNEMLWTHEKWTKPVAPSAEHSDGSSSDSDTDLDY